MTTTIYLIRHGQTDWNKQQIFRGRKDVPLNEHGRKEAEALSAHLKNVKFTACYAGPLSRSFETAEIVARSHNLPVHVDEGMTDISYGVWEGLPVEEVEQRFSSLYDTWLSQPHRVRFPSGESLLIVKRRALYSLEGIRTKHPGETVFVVSHRVVTKVVMCAMLGLSNKAFWKILQDTCAYNIIVSSEKEALVSTLNDTCHLRSAGLAPSLPDF